MNISKEIMDTLLELCKVPGISGTAYENLTAQRIFEILSEIKYFKENSRYLEQVKINGDPLKRSFVSGLFRGKAAGEETIVLTGHFDVVGIDDFGALKELAFDPLKYTERIPEGEIDGEALRDLKSGEWLFGRGTADMKYGIALHIELLRKLSEEEDFPGNILFIGVPGEESNSEGMLAAVPHLLELQRKYGLNYKALLLSECCFPKFSGDDSKKIYLGSCGKVMPLFFFAGKECHVCDALSGLNANLMSSELNRLLEVNSSFCDHDKGSSTPPPVCLKQKDLKNLYSVQTPLFAASYYNLQTLRMSMEDLLIKFRETAIQAFENSVELVNRNISLFEKTAAVSMKRLDFKPKVMFYEELYREVKATLGDSLDEIIKEKLETWGKENMELQDIAINIISTVFGLYSEKQPAIIIGFAPPYYPDKHLNPEEDGDRRLEAAVDELQHYAAENHGVEIFKEDYFTGICDLSYTGIEKGRDNQKAFSNIVGLNQAYFLPWQELRELHIPSIVFGGYGKDYHKNTERLNKPYSLDVVPDLYDQLIRKLLSE